MPKREEIRDGGEEKEATESTLEKGGNEMPKKARNKRRRGGRESNTIHIRKGAGIQGRKDKSASRKTNVKGRGA